jgi:hypothetical protein
MMDAPMAWPRSASLSSTITGADGSRPSRRSAWAIRWWGLIRLRRRLRILGATEAGEPIVKVGDLHGIVENTGAGRGVRPLMPCVRCGCRVPSPAGTIRQRRHLRGVRPSMLCSSCSRSREGPAARSSLPALGATDRSGLAG